MPGGLKILGLCLATVWLGGCSLIQTGRGGAPEFPLLPPASYGARADLQQTLYLAHGAEEYSLQCTVTVDERKLTVRGFSALGQRLFTVEHDGKELQAVVAPMGPAQLPAHQIVSDLQFALWPLAALQQAGDASWQITEPRPGLRRIQQGGRLYAEVHEGHREENSRRFWLTNLVYGYSMDITSETLHEPE